jgi:hypothetical protein
MLTQLQKALPVVLVLILVCTLPGMAIAATGTERLDLTGESVGFFALFFFIAAYVLVLSEEFTFLRKSKPVMLAAGIIWGMIALEYNQHGLSHEVEAAVRLNLREYAASTS